MGYFLLDQTKAHIIRLEQELKELRIDLDQIDYFCDKQQRLMKIIRDKADLLSDLNRELQKMTHAS